MWSLESLGLINKVAYLLATSGQIEADAVKMVCDPFEETRAKLKALLETSEE